MTLSQSLLFLLAAFGAEVIGTMAGFGAATVLTPVAAAFMDIKTAIALVAVFHLFGNTSRLVVFRGNVDWRTVLHFGLPGVALSVVGALVSDRLPSRTLTIVFGSFLMLYVLWSALFPALTLKPSRPALWGGGVCSGFIAGLIGTGGAVRSACLIVLDLSKERYIATSAAIALAVDATRVPVYLAHGFLGGKDEWRLLLALLPVAFLGASCGRKAVSRMPAPLFRRFLLVFLFVVGFKMAFF